MATMHSVGFELYQLAPFVDVATLLIHRKMKKNNPKTFQVPIWGPVLQTLRHPSREIVSGYKSADMPKPSVLSWGGFLCFPFPFLSV